MKIPEENRINQLMNTRSGCTAASQTVEVMQTDWYLQWYMQQSEARKAMEQQSLFSGSRDSSVTHAHITTQRESQKSKHLCFEQLLSLCQLSPPRGHYCAPPSCGSRLAPCSWADGLTSKITADNPVYAEQNTIPYLAHRQTPGQAWVYCSTCAETHSDTTFSGSDFVWLLSWFLFHLFNS